jgi:gluconolactonase
MDEPMFIVHNDDFNSIVGTHADLKIALEWNLPYAYQAGVYDRKVDTVCVTSNHIDPLRSTDKVVVISKLKRGPYGDWTRHQLPSGIKMPSGGVVYNDGVLDGILYYAQGDLQRPGGLVYMESEYPFRVREVLNNYHGRRFNSPKDVAIHPDGYDQGTRCIDSIRTRAMSGPWQMALVGRVAYVSRRMKVCYISDTDFIHGDVNVDFTRASTM